MRRTKLTFTTSRPDEASPLVKYPFSWRASSFAGARQMGYYLRKVLFQSQGVIRISSAGRASSTRGRKERRRGGGGGWSTDETTNRTSFPLPENFSQLFSFDLLPSLWIVSLRTGWRSTPIIPPQAFEKMFSERKNKKYIYIYIFLSNFTLQISRYLFA